MTRNEGQCARLDVARTVGALDIDGAGAYVVAVRLVGGSLCGTTGAAGLKCITPEFSVLLRFLVQATTASNVEGMGNENCKDGILCEKKMGQNIEEVSSFLRYHSCTDHRALAPAALPQGRRSTLYVSAERGAITCYSTLQTHGFFSRSRLTSSILTLASSTKACQVAESVRILHPYRPGSKGTASTPVTYLTKHQRAGRLSFTADLSLLDGGRERQKSEGNEREESHR